MPHLSIIVPHIHDDSGLEITLLSILENRDSDSEILVVHDGGYRDPYGLDQDEAVLIETSKGLSLTSQINLAIASACSPYIQVLMPGSIVESGWYDEALDVMGNQSVSVVCLPIQNDVTGEVYTGLSADSLPHRRVVDQSVGIGGPLLCGGVFRKRALDAMGGWLEQIQREAAEVELALLMSALDLKIAIAETAGIHASKRVAAGFESGYEMGHECGQLACAYASIEETGIVIDSLARRLGHLASGLMSPKTVAERLGWVMGIRNRAYVKTVRERFESAAASLSSGPSTILMPTREASKRKRLAA